jgi:excisionase family DNA binding protein
MESESPRLMARPLKLQEAADLLGVHYMTAYRYVRLGQLNATKAGGTWHVTHEDLDAFRTDHRAVTVPTVDGARRKVRWDSRIETCLVSGDAGGAWSVVESALASSMSPKQVYLDVLQPAMVSIGHRWEVGELDVSVEHRASGIVGRMVGRLGPRFNKRGRRRGIVLVGAPSGEHHGLAVAMLSDLIRDGGYEVIDIGSDIPASSFAEAVRSGGPLAVCISVTRPTSLVAAAEVVAAIRAINAEVLVVLGGQGTTNSLAADVVGADVVLSSVDDLLDVLDALPSSRIETAPEDVLAGK